MKTWNVNAIRAAKGKRKLVCLTAYDFTMARIVDSAGVAMVLVGDSLAMTMLGYETTLPVTMDEMLHHTRAVSRGVTDALVVADMPFMSYQASIDEAVGNAGRFMKDAAADAVKIEGGTVRRDVIRTLTDNDMPVVGHIGLTPQSIKAMGGYKIQGKQSTEAAQLLDDARALDEAGIIALVLECIPAGLAADITAAVSVPTIGIGAGPDCDGQILVTHDMLGMFAGLSPKFAKRYAQLEQDMQAAFSAYKDEVEQGTFPGPEHSF